jgi:phospholipid/cholesterol/gamma-HCH transport system permease protein
MSFRVEKLSSNRLKFVFSGDLNIAKVANIWGSCMEMVKKESPSSLFLDLHAVDYCDGAGLTLITVLKKRQIKNSGDCVVLGLKPEFEKLLAYSEQPLKNSDFNKKINFKFIARLGVKFIEIVAAIKNNIIFIGILAYQTAITLLHPQGLRWRDFFRIMEDTGPQALPIVALIGFLIGLISTFQAAPSFANFGVQIYMVDLVGLGLIREMGPLLTSVLLAGRTASSFAAELGTMKINQEIDALTTMGLNPIRFLVVPRVLGTMLITPLLEIFFIVFGLLGCLLVMISLGYTADAFMERLYHALTPLDYLGGAIKVFVFGLVIAGVGCLHGIRTTFGAQSVGRSTTQAVVNSLIMLVIVDGIFALVYYVLEI